MEKIAYILIITVAIDYLANKIFRIVYHTIEEIKYRIKLEEEGYKLDLFGNVVDTPHKEIKFNSDFERFAFKVVEKK